MTVVALVSAGGGLSRPLRVGGIVLVGVGGMLASVEAEASSCSCSGWCRYCGGCCGDCARCLACSAYWCLGDGATPILR